MALLSSRIAAADAAFAPVRDFYASSLYAERRLDPDVCDFTFGNPHEMPLAGLVSALGETTAPQDKNWYAYKTSEPESQAFLAGEVGSELGLAFEPEDFALTAGAFAAIMLAFHLILDPGDEAIFSEPAWFCYEPMLRAAGAVPRPVALKEPRFDLDIEAIDAAIGPRTRLLIVNTPHNPTGRIYGRDQLQALAGMLDRASARIGRRILLLSDEPYRRLRFDGRDFVSPATVYPATLVSYSYGKVLLAPGQRLGYLAVSPLMEEAERKAFREAMFSAQMALGWCFASALMQHALPRLEALSIDGAALARRRDRLVPVLEAAGCEVLYPEGTFYLWARWPQGDPHARWSALAERGIFVMPGTLMKAPDWFRISLTASDAMIESALPGLGTLLKSAPAAV